MAKKNNRLQGLSRTHIAMLCSQEIYVGYETCFNVLWRGYNRASLAAKHVERWAYSNGVRLDAGKGPIKLDEVH